MNFSRFEFHRLRRGSQKLIASPQAMHAAIAASFRITSLQEVTENNFFTHSDIQIRTKPRVLWRIDDDGRRALLYVVSSEKPDFSHIVEQAGWENKECWATKSYDEFLDSLSFGQEWAFRLAANPTRSSRLGDGQRSQRLAHVTVNQQRQWLLDRCHMLGFDIPLSSHGLPEFDIRYRSIRTFRHGDSFIKISMAVFEGTLKVIEPQLLRQTLVNGIGPAKAYGCGLMTLAPLRRN